MKHIIRIIVVDVVVLVVLILFGAVTLLIAA
jgi:hypothetical protein